MSKKGDTETSESNPKTSSHEQNFIYLGWQKYSSIMLH